MDGGLRAGGEVSETIRLRGGFEAQSAERFVVAQLLFCGYGKVADSQSGLTFMAGDRLSVETPVEAVHGVENRMPPGPVGASAVDKVGDSAANYRLDSTFRRVLPLGERCRCDGLDALLVVERDDGLLAEDFRAVGD